MIKEAIKQMRLLDREVVDGIEIIPTHIGGLWNITHNMAVMETDVNEYFYNPELDTFGNKNDWVCKDGWERIIVSNYLTAQEVDKIFFKLYSNNA